MEQKETRKNIDEAQLTDGGHTNTCNGRDKRVGGRNVSIVSGTPHNPDGCTSGCASKRKELHRCVTLEGADRDDAVLDSRCSTGTHCQRASHFEYQTENHGLSVGHGTRRDTGSPGVGDIIGTIVEGFEESKEGADGKNVCVLVENHLDWSK